MILNTPKRFRRITDSHIVWDNIFNKDEISRIEKICENYNVEFKKALTVGRDEDSDDLEEMRRSKIKFINRDPETAWIFDKYNNLADVMNKGFYGFDIYGYEAFQYTVYDSSENGMYEWHMDAILGENIDVHTMTESTRKLSLVTLLSDPGVDFSGGEFQLNLGNQLHATTVPFKKGTVVAFPSFMCHRVKPILTGIRKSIVIWLEGPKFK